MLSQEELGRLRLHFDPRTSTPEYLVFSCGILNSEGADRLIYRVRARSFSAFNKLGYLSDPVTAQIVSILTPEQLAQCVAASLTRKDDT